MKKSCLAPPAPRRVLQEQFSHLSLLHLRPPSWCQAASAGGVSRPDCGSAAASEESAAALLLVLELGRHLATGTGTTDCLFMGKQYTIIH